MLPVGVLRSPVEARGVQVEAAAALEVQQAGVADAHRGGWVLARAGRRLVREAGVAEVVVRVARPQRNGAQRTKARAKVDVSLHTPRR